MHISIRYQSQNTTQLLDLSLTDHIFHFFARMECCEIKWVALLICWQVDKGHTQPNLIKVTKWIQWRVVWDGVSNRDDKNTLTQT